MIRPHTGGKTFRVLRDKKPALPALPAAPTPTPPVVKIDKPAPAESVVTPPRRGPGRPRKADKIIRAPKPPREHKFIKERYKRRNAVGDVVTTPAGHQIFTDKWGVENIKLHITRKTRI